MNFMDYVRRVRGDRTIWYVILGLSLVSMLIIFSSTGALAFRKMGGNTYYYVMRQLIMQLGGILLILLIIKKYESKFFNKWANLALVISIVCILAGIAIGRGSGRTIPLGPFSFQPAELAKVTLIAWVARMLGNMGDTMDSKTVTFGKIAAGIALLALLLTKVNFSSALLIVATAYVMMFVAQVPYRFLIGSMLFVLAILVAMYFLRGTLPDILYKATRLETVFNRIDRFADHSAKKKNLGLEQDEFAKIAIHNGGILGVGVGKGDISNRMSAAYNDFVFAMIVEEYGLLGGILVMILYLILLTRSLFVIKACKRSYPLFLATGAITMLMLQALVNMGVSSGIIPVTGQPLPWISWGGTSQFFTAIIFGFILTVSAENKAALMAQDQAEEVQTHEQEEDNEDFVLTTE
ncbi:MAG: FtsW/RodA/SpoVE family cell cycle protein [Marinilabiliales bacterium]|nr:FtsW/RodA/SpoVE family cell cycle protein [Marinilabiliales bacterium]